MRTLIDVENALRRKRGLMLSLVCVDRSEQPQWEGRLDSFIQESLAAAVEIKITMWTAKTLTCVHPRNTTKH